MKKIGFTRSRKDGLFLTKLGHVIDHETLALTPHLIGINKGVLEVEDSAAALWEIPAVYLHVYTPKAQYWETNNGEQTLMLVGTMWTPNTIKLLWSPLTETLLIQHFSLGKSGVRLIPFEAGTDEILEALRQIFNA